MAKTRYETFQKIKGYIQAPITSLVYTLTGLFYSRISVGDGITQTAQTESQVHLCNGTPTPNAPIPNNILTIRKGSIYDGASPASEISVMDDVYYSENGNYIMGYRKQGLASASSMIYQEQFFKPTSSTGIAFTPIAYSRVTYSNSTGTWTGSYSNSSYVAAKRSMIGAASGSSVVLLIDMIDTLCNKVKRLGGDISNIDLIGLNEFKSKLEIVERDNQDGRA